MFDAPDCAVALWARAGSWCARSLNDGFVPSRMPARLCDDPDTAVRELVQRGMWLRVKGGFQFHDWSDFQPTRESVESDRAAARERMRRVRNGRSQAKSFDRSSDDVRANNTRTFGRSSRPPSRPDPKEGARARDTPKGPPPASAEPPSRCPQHTGDPSPPPCGACADARRAHEAWKRERADAPTPSPPPFRAGPVRLDPAAAARGAAAARAALPTRRTDA